MPKGFDVDSNYESPQRERLSTNPSRILRSAAGAKNASHKQSENTKPVTRAQTKVIRPVSGTKSARVSKSQPDSLKNGTSTRKTRTQSIAQAHLAQAHERRPSNFSKDGVINEATERKLRCRTNDVLYDVQYHPMDIVTRPGAAATQRYRQKLEDPASSKENFASSQRVTRNRFPSNLDLDPANPFTRPLPKSYRDLTLFDMTLVALQAGDKRTLRMSWDEATEEILSHGFLTPDELENFGGKKALKDRYHELNNTFKDRPSGNETMPPSFSSIIQKVLHGEGQLCYQSFEQLQKSNSISDRESKHANSETELDPDESEDLSFNQELAQQAAVDAQILGLSGRLETHTTPVLIEEPDDTVIHLHVPGRPSRLGSERPIPVPSNDDYSDIDSVIEYDPERSYGSQSSA